MKLSKIHELLRQGKTLRFDGFKIRSLIEDLRFGKASYFVLEGTAYSPLALPFEPKVTID